MIYLQLFWEFFKTGLFAVGGGLATLPFLYDISARCGWFSAQELADMIAVAESTPGPIGVNMATFAGIHAAGLLGGVVATLSIILPSFLIILIITALLNKFRENPYVQSTLSVLRPASVGLIGAAVFSILKIALLVPNIDEIRVSPIAAVLFAVLLAVRWKLPKLHPIVLIAVGAVCGIVFAL